MSEVTESAETSEDLGPGPHLAQVDPPHPFRSALKNIAIAAVAISIAIGLYVWIGQRPPVARGDILTMNLYPVHTLINNGGGSSGDTGMAGTAEYYDQLLILAKVKITNQTDIPLFMQDISAAIKMPDGSDQVNVTASNKDMDRVFQAYPSLSYLRADSIPRDTTLMPGQSVQGLTIFNFPINKEQWDSLQTAKVLVSFMHQKNLEIVLPKK